MITPLQSNNDPKPVKYLKTLPLLESHPFLSTNHVFLAKLKQSKVFRIGETQMLLEIGNFILYLV